MIRLTVTGSGSELQGVARLDDGRAVFVPGALPGEVIEAELTKEKDRFAEARLLRVPEPSPDRREPECPYYEVCGGCRARHMSYECALRLKREKVYSALTRIGGLTDVIVEDTLPSPLTDGYRNKAEFACAGNGIGVFEEGSHRVVNVDRCLLQSEEANRLLAFLKGLHLPIRYAVIRTNGGGEVMLTLSTTYPADLTDAAKRIQSAMPFVKSVWQCLLRRMPAHALDGSCRLLCGEKTLTETLCSLIFSVSPQSFFQVNRLQTENLYAKAMEFACLSPEDRVCDIYCGAGTISLCAARKCKSVTGIEIVPDAIQNAKQNAAVNKLSDKTRFLCGDAAKLYPELSARNAFDCIITDPPRKGMDRAVTDAILKNPAPRLV